MCADYAKYTVGQENATPAPAPEQSKAEHDAARSPGVIRFTLGGGVEHEGIQTATSGPSTAEASQAPLANLVTALHQTPVDHAAAIQAPRDTLVCLDGQWDTLGAALDAGLVVERDGKLYIPTAGERQAAAEANAKAEAPAPIPADAVATLSDSTRNNLGYISRELGDATVVLIASRLAQGQDVPATTMQRMAVHSGKELSEIQDIIARANADFTQASIRAMEQEGVPASLGASFVEWAKSGRTATQYADAFSTMALTGDTRPLRSLAKEFRTNHGGNLRGQDFNGRFIKDPKPGTRVWLDNNSREAMIELPGHGTMTVQLAYSQGLVEFED